MLNWYFWNKEKKVNASHTKKISYDGFLPAPQPKQKYSPQKYIYLLYHYMVPCLTYFAVQFIVVHYSNVWCSLLQCR